MVVPAATSATTCCCKTQQDHKNRIFSIVQRRMGQLLLTSIMRGHLTAKAEEYVKADTKINIVPGLLCAQSRHALKN